MNKKKLTRLIAVCMACLGMGIFAFAGCKKGNGGTADSGKHEEIDEGKDKDKDKDKDKEDEGKEPVISGPVAGGVKELKASENELEAAYVTWKAADNAKWYNVYYSVAGKNSWTQLDAPLVREYKDYFRADIPGLKAGEYDMKVVPVSGEDKEATDYAVTASGITVEAHTREGYAFTDNSVPGAYNMDGTLKAGAQVVYVTAANAATVKANVNGVEVAGFQSIIDARQKKDLEQTPLCFRIVGTVTKANLDHVSSSEEGLQIKGASAASPAENITIEGIGSDGTIKDFGILTRNTRNIEIRNLGILNCMDDGISIDTDNTHLWIHNNDIFYGAGGSGDKAKGDGALDTKQSSLITHSYNHFWDCGKCNLQGMKSEETTNRITYHHNWYDHSDSRHPRIRTGTVHIYNNYYDGNAKYGVGVTTGASAFVENNYFRSTAAMRPMMSSEQGTDATGDGTFSGETGGMIKSYGNYYDCTKANLKLLTQNDTTPDNIDCYEASSRDEQVPATYKTKSGGTVYSNFDTASDMYEYNVDTAEQAKTKVERYAGRIGGGDLKWEFDNEKEDANYAIIPGLKSAVTNYKTSVLKIDGVAVSGSTGGTTEGGNGEGGDEGTTNPPATVTGEIKFVPSASGSGFEVSGNLDSKSTARTVDGVSISAKSALKLESATSVTFSIDKEMTITLYLTVGTIKIDDKAQTSTSEVDGLKVITLKLAAGKHTVSKKDSGSLYLIKLTPVA